MKDSLKKTIVDGMPWLRPFVREVRGRFNSTRLRLFASRQPRFECPICGYTGPFQSHPSDAHKILHTQCPRCENFERHRLQYLVLEDLSTRFDFSSQSILHFAPEPLLTKYFRRRFARHVTADLFMSGVDFREDIRSMSFPDKSFDVVYASHVLEHVDDDAAAITEIRRVLRPGGMAILPVPVVSPVTIEYGEPNPNEFGHVRAVGKDYFERYERSFARIEIWDSLRFPARYQLYTYEDRSQYPTSTSPKRVPMSGEKHCDYVPICFV